MSGYKEVLESVYRKSPHSLPCKLLCLDPGETTGWAEFHNGELVDWGQLETYDKVNKKINWDVIDHLMASIRPTHVICENYRVYAHKLERHSFSEVPTLRIIGGFEFLAYFQGCSIEYQMAVQAKGFVTDARLKKWDFWKENMRHSRDAIRHGIYYLLITHRPKDVK